MLESMLTRTRPDYMESADIKWNFTKFLIDRNGNVVERFEPTADMDVVEGKNQRNSIMIVKTTEILLPIAYSKDTKKRKLYM